jgi:[ribosomal protein S5]-alanine N-acetyltransferase
MLLETQRLILREFKQEDTQKLVSILANSKVMKFSPTGILSMSQTQEKVESFITSYKKYGFGKWAVILKESSELIGYCGIAVETIDYQDEREIGYRFDSKFWGKGLATEAASAALEYGFEKFQLPYILGIVEPSNTASVRVLEKVNMKYERKTVFHNVKMDVYQKSFAT